MTPSSWDRSRRVVAVTCVVTALAAVAAVVVLALAVDAPGAWWPHTGRAFSADTSPAAGDPCGLIVGPAKAYCEGGTAASQHNVASAALRLASAAAGVGALVVWRLRSAAAGQRRR